MRFVSDLYRNSGLEWPAGFGRWFRIHVDLGRLLVGTCCVERWGGLSSTEINTHSSNMPRESSIACLSSVATSHCEEWCYQVSLCWLSRPSHPISSHTCHMEVGSPMCQLTSSVQCGVARYPESNLPSGILMTLMPTRCIYCTAGAHLPQADTTGFDRCIADTQSSVYCIRTAYNQLDYPRCSLRGTWQSMEPNELDISYASRFSDLGNLTRPNHRCR